MVQVATDLDRLPPEYVPMLKKQMRHTHTVGRSEQCFTSIVGAIHCEHRTRPLIWSYGVATAGSSKHLSDQGLSRGVGNVVVNDFIQGLCVPLPLTALVIPLEADHVAPVLKGRDVARELLSKFLCQSLRSMARSVVVVGDDSAVAGNVRVAVSRSGQLVRVSILRKYLHVDCMNLPCTTNWTF